MRTPQIAGIAVATLAAAFSVALPGMHQAFAAPPQNAQNGFGAGASYLGQNGLMGCMSSSFAGEPRDGIGNVADQFGLTVSALGFFLLNLVLGGAPVPGCP
jgi:hypothetical protein